jgi:ATP-dependent Clp protease ATP-binding subunit ClpC
VLVIPEQEALGFGHDAIGTEHLLLGVATPEDQWGAHLLARRGLTATRIRSQIDRLIGRG